MLHLCKLRSVDDLNLRFNPSLPRRELGGLEGLNDTVFLLNLPDEQEAPGPANHSTAACNGDLRVRLSVGIFSIDLDLASPPPAPLTLLWDVDDGQTSSYAIRAEPVNPRAAAFVNLTSSLSSLALPVVLLLQTVAETGTVSDVLEVGHALPFPSFPRSPRSPRSPPLALECCLVALSVWPSFPCPPSLPSLPNNSPLTSGPGPARLRWR